MQGCPTTELLNDFVRDGKIADDVYAHIENCQACSRLVEELCSSTDSGDLPTASAQSLGTPRTEISRSCSDWLPIRRYRKRTKTHMVSFFQALTQPGWRARLLSYRSSHRWRRLWRSLRSLGQSSPATSGVESNSRGWLRPQGAATISA